MGEDSVVPDLLFKRLEDSLDAVMRSVDGLTGRVEEIQKHLEDSLSGPPITDSPLKKRQSLDPKEPVPPSVWTGFF